MKGEPNYDEIVIPNEANYGLQYKIFYDAKRTDNFNIAAINYNLKTSKDKPLSEKVTLININTKEEFTFQTDENGKGIVELPNDATYSINYESVKDYDILTVPKVDNLTFNFNASYEGSSPTAIYPNRTESLFVLTYYDLDSVPIPNEVFTIKTSASKKFFQGKTDEKGEVKILVPVGDTYRVSATFFPYFFSKTIDVMDERSLTKIELYFVSSEDYAKRVLEKKYAAEEWEKLMKKKYFRDSIALLRSEFSGFGNSFHIGNSNITDDIEKRANQDKSALNQDSLFFEKVGDEVAAVLYRNRGRWKNKLIVTDITGSMYPYIDQILSWHILDYNSSINNQYLFFNDGNRQYDTDKIIGRTGGFYYTDAKTLENLIEIMLKTIQAGDGGDIPENDIEALLNAVDKRKNKRTEIILIADNYSDMRDIELVYELDLPVRVIITGLNNNSVNEEYLELAYRTKGSIHTLEDDLENLFQLNDGDHILIDGKYYRIQKGKFIIVR